MTQTTTTRRYADYVTYAAPAKPPMPAQVTLLETVGQAFHYFVFNTAVKGWLLNGIESKDGSFRECAEVVEGAELDVRLSGIVLAAARAADHQEERQ